MVGLGVPGKCVNKYPVVRRNPNLPSFRTKAGGVHTVCPAVGSFFYFQGSHQNWQLESVGTPHVKPSFLRVSFNFLTHISRDFCNLHFFHGFLGLLRDGNICCWGLMDSMNASWLGNKRGTKVWDYFLSEIRIPITLPENNSLPLMDGWKTSFLLGWRNLAGANC